MRVCYIRYADVIIFCYKLSFIFADSVVASRLWSGLVNPGSDIGRQRTIFGKSTSRVVGINGSKRKSNEIKSRPWANSNHSWFQVISRVISSNNIKVISRADPKMTNCE